jgi:flagellar basal body-associated protein FliL
MDPEILKKFEEQEAKLEAVYNSVEKTRKYILWHLIINIVVIVLPIIGLVIAIPWFLKIMTSAYSGMGI